MVTTTQSKRKIKYILHPKFSRIKTSYPWLGFLQLEMKASTWTNSWTRVLTASSWVSKTYIKLLRSSRIRTAIWSSLGWRVPTTANKYSHLITGRSNCVRKLQNRDLWEVIIHLRNCSTKTVTCNRRFLLNKAVCKMASWKSPWGSSLGQ